MIIACMKLSVIIVNYNVKYFLEQCLCSLRLALTQIDTPAEVMVIDNASTDGSLEYLQPRFPDFRFIANPENEGFARANNRALQLARGEFILFLNPDTLVSGDALEESLAFFETQPAAGAVGVKMLDGSGLYLRESKRGFPTPWVSFCKMSGLTRIFPHSALFSRYYLGNLNQHSLHEVEALAGAFMMVRKKVLDKTGGFDERFFMYAEDIDLSYRIRQAGYYNYYLPDAPIIHFKGESTQKDSQYIKRFYGAMIQFVDKHYGAGAWTSGLLKLAIKLRAFLAGLKNTKIEENEVNLTENEEKMVEKAHNSTKNGLMKVGDNFLCITGKEFNHSDLIDLMEIDCGHTYYITHQESGAIICSQSSNGRGRVIPI